MVDFIIKSLRVFRGGGAVVLLLTSSRADAAVTVNDCGNGSGTVNIANPASQDDLATIGGNALCTVSGSEVECSVLNICSNLYPTEMFLTTNTATTGVGNKHDWAFWGKCGMSGAVEFCAIIEDDDTTPVVEYIGMRGTNTVDFMYFSYPVSSPTVHLTKESEMHGDLKGGMWGEEGADWLVGSLSTSLTTVLDKEFLYGGPGNDDIRNENGVVIDEIYGGDGTDFIDSGKKNDIVYGGATWDIIIAGIDADHVYAGAGNDVICGSNASYGSANPASIWSDTTYKSPTSYTGSCTLTNQNDGIDVIYGEDGDDTMWGAAGDDWLFGDLTSLTGTGDDTIHGGSGDDKIWPDGGDDTVNADDDEDSVCDYDGDSNTINLGADNDHVYLEDETDPGGSGSVDGGTGTNTCELDIASVANCTVTAPVACSFDPATAP